MATESIFHNFVISGTEAVERFVDALDESAKNKPTQTISYREVALTDSEAIRQLMAKRLDK